MNDRVDHCLIRNVTVRDQKIFRTFREAQVIIERWRNEGGMRIPARGPQGCRLVMPNEPSNLLKTRLNVKWEKSRRKREQEH